MKKGTTGGVVRMNESESQIKSIVMNFSTGRIGFAVKVLGSQRHFLLL